MVKTPLKNISLEQLLQLPETKPPQEYINGQIIHKSIPKTRHSRLQAKLTATINQVTELEKIAYAFPELRCTFGGRSIVPDIAVLSWENIHFNEDGESMDDILIAPDWIIEIMSPNQSSNRVMGNILHCLDNGSKLGWLIDPDDRSVLCFTPQQQPKLLVGNQELKVLAGIDLKLTAIELFGWLKMY